MTKECKTTQNNDKKHKDLSEKPIFNDLKLKLNEVTVPVVLTEDMKEILMPLGLNKENIRYWKFPYASKKVPIVFMGVETNKEDLCRKYFNDTVSDYLKQHKRDEKLLSLDEMLDSEFDDNKKGIDPTGNNESNETIFYELLYNELINKLNTIDPKMAICIDMIIKGFKTKEILEKLDLGVAKTQGYEFIKKTKHTAKIIIEEIY